ncbi:sugar transporter [Aspergillus insuetus]
MVETRNKATKTANHAWRKKPRRSAPKSRLGCKTCKIRRIKCDLSRPSCLRCSSTGRTCDGYSEMPHAIEMGNTKTSSCHSNRKAETIERCVTYHHSCTIIRTSRPELGHDGLILQNLEPFMILPMTEPAQAEAVHFFEYHSIKHLNEYNPCQSWRETLMFFAQTVPAVRSAAVALALVQRDYLDCGGRPQSSERLKDCLPDKAPLFHYNRAIQFLLTQQSGKGNSIQAMAITLLVCYLFICFDHLAGNDVQAVKHLRGGVELARTIDKDTLNYDHDYDDIVQPSKTQSLICQVARQIRRLDMQAVTFMVDWTPADIREEEQILMSSQQLPLFGGNGSGSSAFCSLEHAADTLQILVARVVRLCNTGQQISPLGRMPPLPDSLKDIIFADLETWSSLFENVLLRGQQGSSAYMIDPGIQLPLVSLLHLQHTMACILLSTAGPGREMEYDNYTAEFQRCLALADDVAAAHKRTSSYRGSSSNNFESRQTPAFTPEIGIVPVLYIIGVKCRHPLIRRNALNILRRHRIREAVWDSVVTARVVERVIQIEEGGEGREQERLVQSAANIPAGQRVQALSFVVSAGGGGGGGGRADITYTFCARKGMYVESLVI